MDTYVQTCLFLLGILSLTGYTSSQQLNCDTGNDWYNLDGSKCYRIFTGDLKRTYERAATICESYGSRLVIIKDQGENDKVAKRVADVAGKPETFYIGLSKVKSDTCATCADFLWSNGDPATDNYGFWSDEQPDDANGDCVYVKKDKETYVYDRPYTWNYGNCLTKRSFVCEKMAAPQNSFHCFSGGFISQNKQCNGIPDCSDGSDELSCGERYHFYHRGASGTLNTSPFPYSNAQTSTWAIETPVGTNVYVKFTNFDTEAGADFVDIYSGSVVESKAMRIDRISGTYASKTYRSFNNMMLIKFSSDAFVTRSGFQATYNSLQSSDGHTIPLIARRAMWQMFTLSPVLSDVDGFNSFLPMYDYVIVIDTESQSQLGPMITLKIEEVTIHKDDKLMFFDGETPSDPLLATYCHSDDCTNYYTVYSTGNSMSILLSTNRGLMNDVTFKFSYRQGCYFESTDNYGTIFTPGFPNNINYPNYVQCTWSINTNEPIAIYFDSDSNLVDEDYNRDFNGDFLEMYIDGNRKDGNSQEGMVTNEFRGLTFLSNGSIELMLKTSPTRSSRGFKATWSNACKNPEFDANTIVSTSETVFYYTSSMTIRCASGYNFHQEQITPGTVSVDLECGYMGFWKTYRQIPKCTPNYCGDVPDIANGYIESSTGSVYGSTATYQCYQGSTLQPAFGGSDNTISCQAVGGWSARPACIARSCSNTITANIANGEATGSGNSIGSIYIFECNSGFRIVGDPIIFCQEDGTWTQINEPTCERLQCWLPNIEHGSFNIFDSFIDFDNSVNVRCDNGYENTGDATVRCTEDRSLDGTPVCTNIDECIRTQPCQMDCQDTDGSFYCTCQDGYELSQNGLNCIDINECTRNTDRCDGGCSDSPGGYECSCNNPYVLYTQDFTSGFGIPTQAGENGLLPSDTYHINHTCVFKTCDAPPSINNGVLLTKRTIHRYDDYIEYQCNIGYMPRRSTLQCGANGNWVGTVPSCSMATCASENPTGLLNRASYLPGPYNYNYVLELNCSRADGDFKKYRYCTYNKDSDSYEMQGSSYECGEVDCGAPVQYSGTLPYNEPSTAYGSSFELRCVNGGLTGTTNAGSISTVRCLADGYWDFGNLQCAGQSCSDPGFPLGGDLVATSFADQSEVTFICLRTGYTLSQDTTLTCQGSSFFGAVPSCIDTTKPVINNCPTESIVVSRYSLLRNVLPNLSAVDNDVVDQFYVKPSNANSTLYVDSNMTVTYTAVDPAGNIEQCIIDVEIIDDEPPTILCPQLTEILLSTNDEMKSLMLDRDNFILNDNRNSIKSFKILNPPPSTYDITSLYRTYTYSATAFDSYDNSATCRGQVFVRPNVCSDLSFLDPLNGQKTCSTSGGVRTCVVRCDQDYTFEDAKEKTIRCQNNQWDTEWLPACVFDTLRPEIICPVSRTINFSEEDDTRIIDFTSLGYSYQDLNDIGPVVFSEDSYEFTFADLYQRKAIQMTVSDIAGNEETCTFEYTVLPNPWSPLALTKPLFSGMTCVRRSAGYDCTITCEAGKILRNVGPSTTVSSNDNGEWSESARFPACVDDTKPPIITACPPSTVEEISAGDEVKTITFGSNAGYAGLYGDISGISQVRYEPASVSLSAADLYNTVPIVMYVADNANNEASCRFEILVRPSPCSELALPNPINGDKSCNYNANARSWTCGITCNNGYYFYQTAATTVQTTCINNGPFDSYVPDCVKDDVLVQPKAIVTLSYDYVPVQDTVLTVSQSCLSHYADEVAFPPSSSVFSVMEDRLFSACDNIFTLPNLLIQMQPDSTDGRVINGRQVRMNYTYIMSNSDSSKYQDCANFIDTQINVGGNTYPLTQEIAGDGSSCPSLKWNFNADVVRSELYCSIPYFESPRNDFACLRCPVGTVSDSVTCNVCGIGTYNDGSVNTCRDCPIGYTTYTLGATSSSQCVASCTSGRISDTGYLPCYSCPKGTYATDSRTCTPCEPGNTTSSVGSTSPSQCFPSTTVTDEPCSIGTEDVGNNVCELCPLGTYRSSSIFQQGCLPCSDSLSTYFVGSTSSSQCYSKCSNGFVSNNGLAPCTPCPKGSYWYNTTTCLPCGPGRTTWGLGSVVSNQCVLEANLRVKCPRGTQRDSTTGECKNCPVGYSNNVEEGTCVVCPNTESTYFPGATSSLMCRSKCPPGFYSSSGLSPCSPCGTSSYSSVYGATSCQSCVAGQTTATTTSTSNLNCISQCQPGTYSYNGYNGANGCSQCPANYYQSNTGAEGCIQCNPGSRYSLATGRTSVNDCNDASDLCNNRCQHGTCRIRNNEAVCDCPAGQYYGSICQFTVNHCLSNPCYNNGTCSQTLGGFTCDCRGHANGNRCENLIDTCDTTQQSPTCANTGHCINYAGYTRCLCRNGYQGPTCQEKSDICITSPCDDVGTFQCIDTSKGSDLRRHCVCRSGYEGDRCETNTDDCASNPCINGGNCNDGINSFSCNCPQGYGGTNCQIRTDFCQNVNCANSNDNQASCVDVHGIDQYMCLCNKGYSYDNSGYAQYSMDPNTVPSAIDNSQPNQGIDTLTDCRDLCTSQLSCMAFSFDSSPPACFLWSANTDLGDRTSVNYPLYTKDIQYPDDDFWTLRYEIMISSSATINRLENLGIDICGGTEPLAQRCCRKGQECDIDSECDFQVNNNVNDYHIQYKCSVNRVFNRNTCTTKTDYCRDSPCQNGGFCTRQFGGYRCTCPTGYTGLNCQTNINECANDPCLHGTCTDGVGLHTCACDDGYTGRNCDNPVNFCEGVTCSSNGQCSNIIGVRYECTCNAGFTGKDCEIRIQYCGRNPCIHGTCELTFNNYRCECDEGWQGSQCDVLTDYCSLPQYGLRCEATCNNIFKGYYCNCPSNTYGVNCENQPSPCINYNKCLNSGSCSDDNNVMTCDCPANYKGDGCETLIDYCGQTNPCMNGAACRVTESSYQCMCAEGFNGALCENQINYCTGVTCRGGTCVNLRHQHYCRCPLGKTGDNCNRDVDTNYDLYFNHPEGNGFAWIPFSVQEDNTNVVSIAIWVRYARDGGNGVYMTQFIGDNLETAERFIELDEEGLTLYLPGNTVERIQYDRNAVFNDGNWHHVVVTCFFNTGAVNLYMDTILFGPVVSPSLVIPNNSYSMWVVLGCEFDNENHRCEMNRDNFHGYLSQVNFYKRELTFNGNPGDISYNFDNPRHVFGNVLSDLSLVWNEYVLETGVTRMIPSEAYGASCNVLNRQPPCNFYTVTSVPTVTGCPRDMRVYSPDRTVTVRWEEPIFDNIGGGNALPPTRTPGSTFAWGVHDITYVAVDEYSNSAYCSFKIYVDSSNCENPEEPFAGRRQCSIDPVSERKGCVISCPNSGSTSYKVDRVHPLLFTCGPSGTWNAVKPFQRYRYPACGVIKTQPTKRAYVRVTYDISTSACNAVYNHLRARTLESLRFLNGVFAGTFCSESDCTDVTITITCGESDNNGRRKRQTNPLDYTTLMEIIIEGADGSVSLNGESISLEEFLTYFILGAGKLDFDDTIPSGNITRENLAIVVTSICPTGEVLVDDTCVECGPGNYYTKDADGVAICHDCPYGSYQPSARQTSCTNCSLGFTTELPGNYEVNACKRSCSLGQYFDNGANACLPCPIGYYQDEVGQFRCKFCDAGFTTIEMGSTSISNCSTSCDHGEQLNGAGGCDACPIGQYRNATLDRTCVQCGPDYITANVASKSAAECTIAACSPGNYRDVDANKCFPCPSNTYQPEKWQTQCILCGDPTHWRTDSTGKSKMEDCLYYCSSGFEVESVGACAICPIGTYKDNDVDKQGNCTMCAGNYRTPTEGSDSSSDCTIYKCDVGLYPNALNNDCLPCPIGTYQDVPFSTQCKGCNPGQSTRQDTSNSSLLCETYCPSGQEKHDDICVKCLKGSYKDNDDGYFGMCVECNSLYTTFTDGSDDVSDCNIRTCHPGTKRNTADTGCVSCPLGTYQPLSYQTICLACPNNPQPTSTRNVNSTSPNDCQTYCPDGYEKVGSNCIPCGLGYYKNNDNDGLFASCQLCPTQYITSVMASTSESACDVANCSAGTYRDVNNDCKYCQKGFYQDKKWQTTCIECGQFKTTENPGADDLLDCILECDAGYEDIGGTCQMCGIGYFKVDSAAAACTECRSGFITVDIGSTSANQCTIPACPAGEYLDRSNPNSLRCRQCAYDTYQDLKWQDTCRQCPGGRPVTLQMASDELSDCVLDCESGREYDFQTQSCQFCDRGYYRNKNERLQTGCQLCPSNRITSIEGSTSVDACNQANCTVPGTYRDTVSNTCKACPVGKYQYLKWQTSCMDCPAGNSTSSTGSTSLSDCKSICPAGEYVGSNNRCQQCNIGYYKSDVDADTCTQCPSGLLTANRGSDDEADCSISPCVAGQRYVMNSLSCVKCVIGSYQPNAGRFQCIDCPNSIKFTAREGAVSVDECRSTCEAGEQFVEATSTCEDCPAGTYQPSQFQFECVACPANRRYSVLGATSQNQCYSFCSPQGSNDCSVNATCALSVNAQGYTCTCFNGYDDLGSSGKECKHTCDRGYCKNNGSVCNRIPQVSCTCTEWYTGARCESRVRADTLSDDTMDIIIPASIAGGGLLLLLVILAVCCLCWRNSQKSPRPQKYSEFNGDRIDKVSVHSYGQPLYTQQPQMLMLAPTQEVVYDNSMYSKDIDRESSLYEPAVFQA